MQGGQNIAQEIQAVEALYNFLVDDICNQIGEVNAQFRGYINVMAETGIQEEECRQFAEKLYVVDESYFKEMYNRIVNCDLPRIKLYLEQLLKQFQAATNNNYGCLSLHVPSQASIHAPSEATERAGGYQDYDLQLNAICDFMDFLVQERDVLMQTIEIYQKYCNDMLAKRVPKQIVDDYVPNYARPNVANINKIIAHIQDEDYKQLSGVYAEIVSSLNDLSQSPSRTPRTL